MAVQKNNVCAARVEVGVDVIGRPHGGQIFGIVEPDDARRVGQGGQRHLVAAAGAVDIFVEAIVEQIVAIAAPGLAGQIQTTLPGWMEALVRQGMSW